MFIHGGNVVRWLRAGEKERKKLFGLRGCKKSKHILQQATYASFCRLQATYLQRGRVRQGRLAKHDAPYVNAACHCGVQKHHAAHDASLMISCKMACVPTAFAGRRAAWTSAGFMLLPTKYAEESPFYQGRQCSGWRHEFVDSIYGGRNRGRRFGLQALILHLLRARFVVGKSGIKLQESFGLHGVVSRKKWRNVGCATCPAKPV
jgi:hypothetical protein